MDNKLYVVKHIIHPFAYLCLVCYTISHMSQARNVIILILVLLFIFIGVGVAISRLKKTEKTTNVKTPGFLSRIFSDLKDPISTSSAATATGATITPKPTGETPMVFNQPTAIPTSTVVAAPFITPSISSQKGGNAEQIPATGAPTWVLLVALCGLVSGVKLYRKS